MSKKILIANRGEIAVRIIRAARELNMSTVAVFSQADKNSLHVKLADESLCIGPPQATHSYLNKRNILAAAEAIGADAIHPGYGFLAENADFAAMCLKHGFIFIGPTPNAISKMGDKATARKSADQSGVRSTPGTGIIRDAISAMNEVEKTIGFPVMIKATAGGGGKGMRLARAADELEHNISAAQNEAGAAFGNPDVYIEKFVEAPRHVELQIIADNYGNVIHLGERDCSIQRRHQKLVEEAPSVGLPEQIREAMGQSAVKLAEAIGYNSAGTVEFLVDNNHEFYFMEMNTRIQVEHPVSEMITGIDIIKLQIQSAFGEALPLVQNDICFSGHSIECRINAENTEAGFLPSPGKIKTFIVPGGPGVRVDTHVYQGYEISPWYDSLIAKLIVHAPTRNEAIARMKRALNEFVIDGVHTTLPFHIKIMNNREYIEGNITTGFIAEGLGRER